jgi:lipopolysaccharide heptosyltransferase II
LKLRAERFDLVIDLQGLARSGAFAWLANGGFTIGVDDTREGAACFYDMAVRRPSAQTHAVDWYLEVVRRLGIEPVTDLPWLAPRPLVRATLDVRLQLSQRRWILLNPGARWWNKRWPAASFRETLRWFAATFPQHHFGILGGKEDLIVANEILEGARDRTVNLAGATSLGELVEVIRAAELIVTNDTGPMHIAAALGTPMVALFGPTNPNRTGPYGRSADVLREPLECSPCLSQTCRNPRQMECMIALSVDRVLEAALARVQP